MRWRRHFGSRRQLALWVATMILVPLAIIGGLVIAFVAYNFWVGVKHLEFMDLGRAFGQTSSDAACLAEGAVVEIESEATLGASVMIPPGYSWLRGCLETATRTDEFCAPVPHPQDPAAETWTEAQCEAGPRSTSEIRPNVDVSKPANG